MDGVGEWCTTSYEIARGNRIEILAVLFFLAVTPFGLMAKFGGKRFLETRWGRGQTNYWQTRQSSLDAKDRYEKRF